MHFGQTLRVLRTTAGLSLRGLARRVGLSPAYLSQVERGKLPPPKEEWVVKIEEVLGLKPGYLMSSSERLDSEAATFLQTVPEATDFLHSAIEAGLDGGDFMDLAAILKHRGRGGLQRLMRGVIDVDENLETGLSLSEYLEEELVFEITNCPDKGTLFQELVHQVAPHIPGVDEEELLEKLWSREREASTGVGSGIAVPHAIVPELAEAIVVLAVARDGVDYDAIDGQPVTTCFLLIASEEQRAIHLGLLARIAQLCTHPDFRAGLLQVSGPAEVLRFLRRMSTRIP